MQRDSNRQNLSRHDSTQYRLTKSAGRAAFFPRCRSMCTTPSWAFLSSMIMLFLGKRMIDCFLWAQGLLYALLISFFPCNSQFQILFSASSNTKLPCPSLTSYIQYTSTEYYRCVILLFVLYFPILRGMLILVSSNNYEEARQQNNQDNIICYLFETYRD